MDTKNTAYVLTPEDRALAARFAGTLERQPAKRSVDELTEDDLQAIDMAMHRDKQVDGWFQRQCQSAMFLQLNRPGGQS